MIDLVQQHKKIPWYSAWECLSCHRVLEADRQQVVLMNLHNVRLQIENENLRQKICGLQESALTYDSILAAVPDLIYRLDPEGTIVYINDAIQRYGYSINELIGRNIFDIIHPDDRKKAQYQVNERRTGSRQTKCFEVRLLSRTESPTAAFKDDTQKCDEVVILSLSANGVYTDHSESNRAFLGTQGIARDITEKRTIEKEKKDLEKKLRQTQKLEAIGTLASGIAHDFNNIIFPIMGNTELALDELPPGNAAHDHLKEILKASNRAKEMIRQILTFSRQAEDEREPIEIEPIVKEALKLLRSSIPTTIEIKQHIGSSGAVVLASPSHIHQIVMNLCTNAYHAMKATGGILDVEISQSDAPKGSFDSFPMLDTQNYTCLFVRDNGCGIIPSELEKIFDPYYSTKSQNEGTGLGLAVIHGIVKEMNGHITVQSNPNKGTTFCVYLPNIPKDTDLPPKVESDVTGGNETILVVDDEDVIVRMIKKMLSRFGYQVIGRTSSIEALEAFRVKKDQIDLVITDQTMPNLTGDQLARKIFAIKREIPIILCTGFSELIDEERAQLLGIKAFIKKPIIKNEIGSVIRKVLDEAMMAQKKGEDDANLYNK